MADTVDLDGLVSRLNLLATDDRYDIQTAVRSSLAGAATAIVSLQQQREAMREDRDSHQRQAIRNLEDADSYKASMKQYFEQSLSEHNAKVALQQQVADLRETLSGIVECTHRPNPTDQSRIDVAPGRHREFGAAIERARKVLEPKP